MDHIICVGDAILYFQSEKALEILSKQKPMNKGTIERVKAALSRKGVVLEQSDEWDRHLMFTGKEAVTFTDGTMVMHTKVSASGFYEELIHYGQIVNGRAICGDEANNLLMEIEAKRKLIHNRKAYEITDYEVAVLQNVLDKYILQLENLRKGGI